MLYAKRHALVVLAACALGVSAAPRAGADAEPPGSQGTPPPATPEGCHGSATVGYKGLVGDPAQGPAIVDQTQTDAGRGETLQVFLASYCGVGSQTP
jgi:hypothetical protein